MLLYIKALLYLCIKQRLKQTNVQTQDKKSNMEKTITAENIHANPDEPVMAQLRKMQPDDRLEFDTRKVRESYLRSVCSRFGWEWGVTFSVSLDRARRTVTVTRTA